MGYVLTLIYVCLALLSPLDLVPSLAPYRIELVVVAVALLFSLPGLLDSRFFRVPQNYLLAGLLAAVSLSVALGEHWLGGGLIALQQFLPAAVVFYLVVLNCQSLTRLRVLVSVLVIVAAFYVVQGAIAYLGGDINSPLLQVSPISDGTVAFRMQGLGFLRDPNELAQFLVMILPFLWALWRPGAYLRNISFVMAPTLFFVWGIYLTHSRGAILALVVILMLSLKDRVNLATTILGGGLALSILLALNFSGGREISLQSGSDRLAFWGDGLRLFLQSPVFGIGFESFAGQNHGHTAHNSFVVCLAELGLVGYAFWVGLLAFTISGLNSLIASLTMWRTNAASVSIEDDKTGEGLEQENADLEKWARAVRISLAGFLAAAFFLSRAYVMPLYLILGMAVVILNLASEREEPGSWQPMSKMVGLTAGLGFAAIALVYVTLRIRSVLS
jgi:O-antigen ligase